MFVRAYNCINSDTNVLGGLWNTFLLFLTPYLLFYLLSWVSYFCCNRNTNSPLFSSLSTFLSWYDISRLEKNSYLKEYNLKYRTISVKKKLKKYQNLTVPETNRWVKQKCFLISKWPSSTMFQVFNTRRFRLSLILLCHSRPCNFRSEVILFKKKKLPIKYFPNASLIFVFPVNEGCSSGVVV